MKVVNHLKIGFVDAKKAYNNVYSDNLNQVFEHLNPTQEAL